MNISRIDRGLLFALMILTLSGCVSIQPHPDVRSQSHWNNWKDRPIDERIGPASAAVVEFIRNDNIKNEIPNRPYRPEYDKALWDDVREAVRSMPETVKTLASKKLAGIVLMNELGSTGFSEIIRDEQGHAVSGFIVLDVKAIDRKANDWATWKENSPFSEDKSVVLKATIENPEHDNRIQTIQYILLHEIGHIIAIGENFHPSWDQPLPSAGELQHYPFTLLSWSVNTESQGYSFRESLNGLGCYPLRYYTANPRASRTKAESCYRAIEQTNFVSLYAGTNPFDDFAESFVTYVHIVLLQKPWQVEISNANSAYRYAPNWHEDRLKAKRKIIESLF